MKLRRFLALFFALALLLGAVPALAAGGSASAANTDVTLTDANSSLGVAYILLTVANNSDEPITLTGLSCTGASNSGINKSAFSLPKDSAGVVIPISLAALEAKNILISAGVPSAVTGQVTATFDLSFTSTSVPTFTKSASVALNFGTPTVPTPDPTGA
ncbi:MAG TPA: hypothetical protein VN540_02820, partial [Clostridia bacterium]|nr:hypothetical protein [Clostridia bacterium]